MHTRTLPDPFILLSDITSDILVDIKYASDDNMIGRPLAGYKTHAQAVLTREAANTLLLIAQEIQKPAIKKLLNRQNPKLMIYEAYRPLKACQDLWMWSQDSCEKTKATYYPNINKRDFFTLGYVVLFSSHARGSTVDLTIGDYHQGKFQPLDMGTRFDFMDPLSHPDNRDISPLAFDNRQVLRKLMNDFGWQGIDTEWWHYTLIDEPFKDTYFDF